MKRQGPRLPLTSSVEELEAVRVIRRSTIVFARLIERANLLTKC